MLSGQILHQSFGDERKSQCSECKIKFKDYQPRYLHDHSGYPCNYVICMLCCLNKARAYQLYHKQILIKCCSAKIQNLTQSLNYLLSSYCIICGTKCQQQKAQLGKGNQYFYVGIQCYIKLSAKRYKIYPWKTSYQSKILEEIQCYCYLACNFCSDGQVNIIKAQNKSMIVSKGQELMSYYEISKQWKICKQCYNKSIKDEKNKSDITYHKCATCDQIQVYEKLPNIFGLGGKKLLDLVKVPKEWPEGNQKLWKCSFCIYKAYLQTQYQSSKYQITKSVYNELKISYQEHFMVYCMMCSSKVSSSMQIYPIKSQVSFGVYSFLCSRCYLDHTRQLKQPFKYKCSKQLRQYLVRTKQDKLKQQQIIDKDGLQERGKMLIQIFERQRGSLQTSALRKNKSYIQDSFFQKTQDEYQDTLYDENYYRKQNTSMINHFDMQSEQYRSIIYPLEIDNSLKETILQPQSDAKSQSQIHSSMKDFDDQNDSLITHNNRIYQNPPKVLDFNQELENFSFEPVQKSQNELRKFDVSSWQKSIIQEFRNISENEQSFDVVPQHMYKVDSEQKWAQRKIITQAKNWPTKQCCLMYKECKFQQQYLNLSLLCNLCFAKFLVGDNRIIEAVQRKQKYQVEQVKSEQKTVIKQNQIKGNQKQYKGFFNSIF